MEVPLPSRGSGASRPYRGSGASRPYRGSGASRLYRGLGASRPSRGSGASRPYRGSGASRPSMGSGASRPSMGSGASRFSIKISWTPCFFLFASLVCSVEAKCPRKLNIILSNIFLKILFLTNQIFIQSCQQQMQQ